MTPPTSTGPRGRRAVRHRLSTTVWLVAGLLLGTACKPGGRLPPRDPLAEERQLALAPSSGAPVLDAELTLLQGKAQKSPGDADAWVALGKAWVRKARSAGDPGYYLSADASVRLALEAAPEHRAALGLRTLVLLNQHAFAEARDLARSILARNPDDLVALAALSDAALELGEVPESIAAAQRMIDLKPSLPSYGRAAHLRWLTGDVAGAKQAYRAAIDSGLGARDPEPLAWTVVQTAMVFWHEGDLGGAEAGCDQALARLPDYPPALVCKGRVSLARGDAPRAASLLERADAQQPLVETVWLLAQARAAAGDAPGAEEAYARAIRRGRQSDGLTLGLLEATRNHDLPEALAVLARERQVRPGPYVEDAYAWALHRSGRLAEARAASDRAIAHHTPDARLLFHAGAIRIAQGETAAGLAFLQRALALNPPSDADGAQEATALVKQVTTRRAAR